MTTVLEKKLSVDVYLDREQASQRKSEYVDGEVREMTEASRSHNLICWRILVALAPQLDAKSLEAYPSEMRVRTDERGPYYYPDIVIAPSPPKILKDRGDTLLDPLVVFEVLSPSTESIDRGEKLANYAAIDSLNDYVIVAQDHVRVDHHSRQSDGSWRLVIHDDLTRTVDLASIGVRLSLAEIYDRIFPPEPEAS